MSGQTPLSTPVVRPTVAQRPTCLACAEGDHEQVPRTECCACPCHGQADLIAAVEVAA